MVNPLCRDSGFAWWQRRPEAEAGSSGWGLKTKPVAGFNPRQIKAEQGANRAGRANAAFFVARQAARLPHCRPRRAPVSRSRSAFSLMKPAASR